MNITVEDLIKKNACEDQVELFYRWIGGSVEVTDDKIKEACLFGLDVHWFFDKFDYKFTGCLDNGLKEWWFDGKRHKEDVAAIERC